MGKQCVNKKLEISLFPPYGNISGGVIKIAVKIIQELYPYKTWMKTPIRERVS
jgi:hypothetical protein